MSGIFGPSTGTCGIFSPGFCGGGTQVTVSYVRSEALLRHRMPVQNTAGEVLNSYAAIAPVTGDLQPNKGQIQRLIGGQVVEVAYIFLVPGVPDVQERDRCYIEGWQVEVVAVNQWGGEHAEIFHTYVGR